MYYYYESEYLYNYEIDFDLKNIPEIDDLELSFEIILPNKVSLNNKDPQLEILSNHIVWKLIPGEMNNLEFSFWAWNKLLLGVVFILLLITIFYFIRIFRFKLGTDLPQLPPN